MNTESQVSIFETIPMSRSTDPVTSHEAAEDMVRTGKKQAHQNIVISLVKRYPNCTYRELMRAHITESVTPVMTESCQYSRRLPELVDMGIVERGPSRKCSVAGSNMTTWHMRKSAA